MVSLGSLSPDGSSLLLEVYRQRMGHEGSTAHSNDLFMPIPWVSCAIRAAWKELGDLPADEAKLQYVGLVKSACPDFQEAQEGKSKGGPGGPVFSSLAEGPEDSQTGPVSTFCSLLPEGCHVAMPTAASAARCSWCEHLALMMACLRSRVEDAIGPRVCILHGSTSQSPEMMTPLCTMCHKQPVCAHAASGQPASASQRG